MFARLPMSISWKGVYWYVYWLDMFILFHMFQAFRGRNNAWISFFQNQEFTKSGLCFWSVLPNLAASSGASTNWIFSMHSNARGSQTPSNFCACHIKENISLEYYIVKNEQVTQSHSTQAYSTWWKYQTS